MIRPLLVANWKMHPSNSKDALDLALEVQKGVRGAEADVVLCPPFVYVPDLLVADNVFLGAQDCFWHQEGPYTGEISPLMLKNLGCSYVIIGHSERARLLQETPPMVLAKLQAALQVSLIPVVCVSNPANEMDELVQGLSQENLSHCVFVYEPAGAISTNGGKAVSPQDAVREIEGMKQKLSENTPVLYGGSVSSENVRQFVGKGLAEGVLVGAASLDAKEFVALVQAAVL